MMGEPKRLWNAPGLNLKTKTGFKLLLFSALLSLAFADARVRSGREIPVDFAECDG
jgi:hypothetical protein